MKKDVVVCIGTVGRPTFAKCKRTVDRLKKIDSRVKKVVVIRNKKSQAEWLNEMIKQSEGYTWCLQVDEDMYVNTNCIEKLINLAKTSESRGKKILNASGMLFDLFLEQNIGSIKLWRVDHLKKFSFKDVMGTDRDMARQGQELGYQVVSTKDVLGLHDSAPTVAIGISKYKTYIDKLVKFGSEAKALEFVNTMKKRKPGDKIVLSMDKYVKDLGLSKRITISKNILICITTHNREAGYNDLILRIDREFDALKRSGYSVTVVTVDDHSQTSYASSNLINKKNGWHVFRNEYVYGREEYWKSYNKMLRFAKESWFSKLSNYSNSYVYFLQDDNILKSNFLKSTIGFFDRFSDKTMAVNLYRDETFPPGKIKSGRWYSKNIETFDGYDKVHFVDGMWMCNYNFLESFNFHIPEIDKSRWKKNPQISSGVGRYITLSNIDKSSVYMEWKSPIQHANVKSKMYGNENVQSPYFSKKSKLTEKNLLTQDSNDNCNYSVILTGYKRPEYLSAQIEAVFSQTIKPSSVYVWVNNVSCFEDVHDERVKFIRSDENFSFWARFYFLGMVRSEFILLLDDDTIPGKKWVQNCYDSFKKQPGIYGTNGIKLRGDFYYPNTCFGWKNPNEKAVHVHLVGHSWFFKQEYVQYMTKEKPLTYENGEDIFFSYSCKKYGGLNTYVPPHPKDDKEMWGSVSGHKGEDGKGVSKDLENHYSVRTSIVKHYMSKGW